MLSIRSKKIVLAGGHAATAAVAVAEEMLKRKGAPLKIYWIGAKMAIEGSKVPTLESQIFAKLHVTSYAISAGKLQTRFGRWTIFSWAKIPFGFFSASTILLRVKPDLILSFGGFAAFPVVLAGWIMGIPIILHEQTAAAGRANKLSRFFARKIAVARPQSLKYFPDGKSIIVGNPIMSKITKLPIKIKLGSSPTILVMGGSRGSRTINALIEPILLDLLKKYRLIHQTGMLDFDKFSQIRQTLPQNMKGKYEVYSQIAPRFMADTYRKADIFVGRAGANTVSEVIAIKIPAIFIPLPFAYEDEQTKNALFAAKLGLAKVLRQNETTPKALLREIGDTSLNWDEILHRVEDIKSPDTNAAARLVDLIFDELGVR